MDNTIRADQIRERQATTAFCFRGYNNTNLGRTPELLDHPAYGPVLSRGSCSKTPRSAPRPRAASST